MTNDTSPQKRRRRRTVGDCPGTALARQLGTEGESLAGIDAAAKVRIPSHSRRLPGAVAGAAAVTVPLLAEGDGGWEPAVAGAVVQRCCFDYAVTLHIAAASGWELRIEQPFVVIAADGTEHLVVPEERAGLPAALGLLGYRVVSISAHTDGRISAEFDQACRLEVPPSEGFEPWTLTGPDGVRLVSLPGVMALMALPSPHEVPSGERFWRLSFED